MRRFWTAAMIAVLALAAGVWWASQAPDTPVFQPLTTEKPDENSPAPVERPVGAAPDLIRIAVVAPLTGFPAGVRSALPDVARFFADRVNVNGGLLGRTVDLAILDNANTALGARLAAERAADAEVLAVLGGQRSSNALAMAKALQDAAIPMIAVGASHPDVTRMGDWIFRINFTDAFQGAALARFARDRLNAASAAIMVNIGNAYSPYLADVFAEQFQQLGGTVLLLQEYLPDKVRFDDVAAAIGAADPDVVFVPGYQDDSARIVAAARRAGVRSTFIGGDGWDQRIGQAIGEAADGSYYSAHWQRDAEMGGGLADAVAALATEKGKSIEDVEMLALDAVHLLFDAIRRAGTTDRGAVRDALAAADGFVGGCGPYRFDRNGDPEKPLAILRFDKGMPTCYTTMRPETIPFGVIFAKTGDAAPVNRLGFEAARFAADEINLKGGVLSRRIDLIEYDNKTTAIGSLRAAEAAIRDGARAVIGASWSSHSLIMAPIMEAARIPMVSPASTSPSVTRDRPYVFRTCYTDERQGEAMAHFALTTLKARTAAVMTNASNQYSVDLAHFFMERFRRAGQVVAEIDYLQTANQFSSELQEIQRFSPDVVFIPGYARDSAFIIRQARNMGIGSTFLGGDGWGNSMYNYAGDAVIGSYFADNWHIDQPGPANRDFSKRYVERLQYPPSALVALTYDTVYLLADAVRRARSTAPEVIREALADTRDFIGLTGPVVFDANGDPRKQVVILRFGPDGAVFDRILEIEGPKSRID